MTDLDAMLEAVKLPGCVTDLNSCLANVDANAFSHSCVGSDCYRQIGMEMTNGRAIKCPQIQRSTDSGDEVT